MGTMSMNVENAIWLMALWLRLVVIAFLFYRHVWRTLPFFCSYCIWDLPAISQYLESARLIPRFYFHAYFAQAAI